MFSKFTVKFLEFLLGLHVHLIYLDSLSNKSYSFTLYIEGLSIRYTTLRHTMKTFLRIFIVKSVNFTLRTQSGYRFSTK